MPFDGERTAGFMADPRERTLTLYQLQGHSHHLNSGARIARIGRNIWPRTKGAPWQILLASIILLSDMHGIPRVSFDVRGSGIRIVACSSSDLERTQRS